MGVEIHTYSRNMNHQAKINRAKQRIFRAFTNADEFLGYQPNPKRAWIAEALSHAPDNHGANLGTISIEPKIYIHNLTTGDMDNLHGCPYSLRDIELSLSDSVFRNHYELKQTGKNGPISLPILSTDYPLWESAESTLDAYTVQYRWQHVGGRVDLRTDLVLFLGVK
jgi:hypothetical protein